MINFKLPKKELSSLDTEIERLLGIISEMDPTEENYDKVSEQIVKLKKADTKARLSPDAMLAAATNLTGILFILKYEHAHVITTKAFTHIFKTAK